MQIFDNMKFDLMITLLTYVLMDNFCPCFHKFLKDVKTGVKTEFFVRCRRTYVLKNKHIIRGGYKNFILNESTKSVAMEISKYSKRN